MGEVKQVVFSNCMSNVLNIFLKVRRIIFDKILTPILSLLVWFLSRIFPGNILAPIFLQYGFVLLRSHYYLPIPDKDDLDFKKKTELVGVDINEKSALNLLKRVVSRYKAEFNDFPVDHSEKPEDYFLTNGTFMAIDGNVYYSLIRHFKPATIIEVGSGQSTRLAAAAIRKNTADMGKNSTKLICIEPYPDPTLTRLPEVDKLIQKKVQTIDFNLFAKLKANDILFIDSTHVLKPGGDVWWEYCEILPRLAPGVLVHVHDIYLPKSYPEVYFDNYWYWTEQYVLQTFLAFNNRFEVIWPGNYLMNKHPKVIKAAFKPEYNQMRKKFPLSEPSSLWLRVRDT